MPIAEIDAHRVVADQLHVDCEQRPVVFRCGQNGKWITLKFFSKFALVSAGRQLAKVRDRIKRTTAVGPLDGEPLFPIEIKTFGWIHWRIIRSRRIGTYVERVQAHGFESVGCRGAMRSILKTNSNHLMNRILPKFGTGILPRLW